MRIAHSKPAPAVIIGGGMAGLATAVALRNVGVEVTVFEKSENVAHDSSRGAGFLLMSNGLRALDRLGLGGQARSAGVSARRIVVRTSDGAIIREKEVPEHVALTRTALQRILLDALPPALVTRGSQFTRLAYDRRGTAVEAVFANGQKVSGAWFVGADGVGSQVRRLLCPGDVLSPVLVRELLSLVYAPQLATELHGTFPRVLHPDGGLSVGILPVGGGEVIWHLACDAHRWRFPERSAEAMRAFASGLLSEWSEPIASLAAATDFSRSYVWNTTDRQLPLSVWPGNVVLLGDAATTFLPLSTQGVNTALQDAVALAKFVGAAPVASPLSTTLADFHTSRRARHARYLQYGRERAEAFLDPVRWADDIPFPDEFDHEELVATTYSTTKETVEPLLRREREAVS